MVNVLDSLDLFPGRDAKECAAGRRSPVLCQSGLTALFQIEKNVLEGVSNRGKEKSTRV
jgi:hypothetical protein